MSDRLAGNEAGSDVVVAAVEVVGGGVVVGSLLVSEPLERGSVPVGPGDDPEHETTARTATASKARRTRVTLITYVDVLQSNKVHARYIVRCRVWRCGSTRFSDVGLLYSPPMDPKNSMIRCVSSEKAQRSVTFPSFMWAISAVR